MITRFIHWLLRFFYRVEIHGLEHFASAGKRVLIVANHTSFLDGLLLASFLPDKPSFAVNTRIARRWYFKPLLALVSTFNMDPTKPLSLKSLIRYLKADNKVVIFPEGRITVTGALMKIYYGPGMVADRSAAQVLPVRIDGAQYTPFSRLRGRIRLRWFPKITLTVLPPRRIEPPKELRGRARRNRAGQALSDIMTDMMFATSHYHRSVFQAVLDARHIHGGKHVIVEDIERRPLNYRQLIMRSFILADLLGSQTRAGENVGVLLPNTNATVVLFLALHIGKRVPAMLNFSAGTRAMRNACKAAQIATVYTSRQFVERARLEEAVAQLIEDVEVVYLEDQVAQVGLLTRLRGVLSGMVAPLVYRRTAGKVQADDPAVILFTSGTEGTPKGVVLSHANILANCAQVAARVDYQVQDRVLNALPMFHSFGLSAGTLLPLTAGMRTFFYPSPLHYRIVPEMAYDIGATILFGTNTFLKGYARFAHPYDFYTLRYVFAGAEKLSEDTRRVWSDKFGVRIIEGYGATEASPVLASNTPMDNRIGTVGRLLPGIEYLLDEVPGVTNGKRLQVRGPNIMLGYLRVEQPGVLETPQTERGPGWYDTGDIVDMDADGFIRILGRAKRFAKIGGEMVSLGEVEALVSVIWPEHAHAVIAVPDIVKGEQLALVTEQPDADRKTIQQFVRQQGASELTVPRRILHIKSLPVLGSGKIDYAAVERQAESRD